MLTLTRTKFSFRNLPWFDNKRYATPCTNYCTLSDADVVPICGVIAPTPRILTLPRNLAFRATKPLRASFGAFENLPATFTCARFIRLPMLIRAQTCLITKWLRPCNFAAAMNCGATICARISITIFFTIIRRIFTMLTTILHQVGPRTIGCKYLTTIFTQFLLNYQNEFLLVAHFWVFKHNIKSNINH